MKSKIAEAIRLKTQPVAVYRAESCPEGEKVLQFQEGKWGCVVAMLNAASKGSTAALCDRMVACRGGKAGLGLRKFRLGEIEYFLSTGGKGPRDGEFYKKSPELARKYIEGLPDVRTERYIIFRPLSALGDETPETVVFLVNADQLSGLVTLANYDSAVQDNVRALFGAGCAQAILYGLDENIRGTGLCYIGLTDPSARTHISKELLSFSIPYKRFLEMEENVEGSFLHTETWAKIAERI